ncbi:Lysosomal thioesterase PPT2-B [Channa argus]|uniref:palmitoyl-CoA hydrolase n=1 Tax=Channa argus TaxID=215402 RepID=A0A6G1PQ05_CHAAH|nr:Lysosomal thioesterase PPT2-B [Channa argus]
MKNPLIMRGSPLLFLLLAGVCVAGYRPVIIVHGIFDGPKQFEKLRNFICKVHPGTEVTVIDLYNNLASMKPMWKQVQGFREAIGPIMRRAPDGIHLLCFSQGGLICRALLSTTPNHNVNTFISLSSPIAGQFGAWRDNFLRLKKLVLIGGPDDGVITPWQSSLFGFFDCNENVVEMRNQEFYKNDTFGLKTLDTRGKVSVCVQSGVKHVTWHSNYTVFMNCIEKWLT